MNYNSSRWSSEAEVTTAAYQSSIVPPKRNFGIQPSKERVEYADFWTRYLAYALDGFILAMLIVIPTILDPSFRNSITNNPVANVSVFNLFVLLYFAGMESSASQGTLGKMALGLKVTDTDGDRISFPRALARTGGKVLSSLFCNIGYVIAAFTGRKQALHDIIAGCLVVREIR